MRHTYECATRWGDLDPLGHVNNVVYADYLQEARADLLRERGAGRVGGQSDGLVVVRHEIEYVAQMRFSLKPVTIESWVSETRASTLTLEHEVYRPDPTAPGGRTVFVRARSLLAPFDLATQEPRRLRPQDRESLSTYAESTDAPPCRPAPFTVSRDRAAHYPINVRFSDLDVLGHVNNVNYLGYFQEARIWLMGELQRGLDAPRQASVIAHTDIDYLAPLLLRAETYDCWSQIGRVGTRSATVLSEITDGDQVLARATVVMVSIDPATGQSAEPHPDLRARMLQSAGKSS